MPAYVKDTNGVSFDNVFTATTGNAFNGDVISIAIQSDGKLVIGGFFTTFNGVTVNYIVRLNSDGTRDTTFTTNTGTAFNEAIRSIAIQSDGKLIIGGDFTTFNGATVNRIIRLNTDGTRDTTFTTNTGTAFSGFPTSIAIQSDGKFVIVGDFTTFNGVTVRNIVRLNSDGTRDASFTTNTGTGFNRTPGSIVIQSDGKIVIGSGYSVISGTSTFNGVTINGIVRLNSDGTRDTTFTTNTGTALNFGLINSIAIQSDGKLVIGGTFTSFNGVTVNHIVRLNSDGTRDTTFTTNTGTAFNSDVFAIAIQSDGKIVIGGIFTSFNGVTVTRIVRLNSNGTRDTAFTTNTGTAFNSDVRSIAIQSDGKLVIGGIFTSFNGVTANRIIVLNNWAKTSPWGKSSGAWAKAKEAYANVAGTWKQWWLDGGVNDRTFTEFDVYNGFNEAVQSVAVQSDGKMVCGGSFTTFNGITVNFIARLKSDGTLDTAFTTNAGTAFNNSVRSISIQSDGKLVIVGFFSTFNGVTVNRIVRLNSDGTRDTTFTTNTGTAFNGNVYSIAIQSDGKLIIGGQFTTFNGITVNRIVRLNADGTRDTSFTTNTGTAFNSTVQTIAIQSDGKLVIGGAFTTFNSTTANYIVRLNSDGTRDTVFTTNTGTGPANIVETIAIQSDGKIVIGGVFSTFNGVTVNRIVRLNSDGTRDTTFTTNTGTGFNNAIISIAIQSDGKLVIGGGPTTFNGVTVNRIVRLNSDGTRDTTFTTNTGTAFDSTVQTIAIQSDGKIVIGGVFSTFNGATVNCIVRLNSDGTRDTGIAISSAFNNAVRSIAIQSDGKLIIGGDFTTFNGVTANYIIRLNSDGTRDTAFTTNIGTAFNSSVLSIAIQSDGKLVIGGTFFTFNGITVNRIVRLNADGTRDTSFTTNTGTAFDGQVESIAIQSDGKLVIVGFFSTFNGATVNSIARLNSDGTRDTVFTTNTGTAFNSQVFSVAIQSDGKIICGTSFNFGSFTSQFNGVVINYIVRLNSNGTRDTTFTTNTGSAFNSPVRCLAIQSDGKLMIGGQFTTFNGVTVNNIVRLNADGTRDSTFTTNTGTAFDSSAFSIAVQSDGKIVIGGQFTTFNGVTVTRIVRLNADGTRDTSFTTNTGTAFDSTVQTIAVQTDGKIVIGGSFFGFSNINRTRLARIGGE
jgi:uncharacterized delta-60 repeat protein